MARNWAGNVDIEARREIRVSAATGASPSELARRMGEVENAVRRAIAEGRRIRPLGSAWSFSELMQAEDDVVSVASFDRILGTSPGTAWLSQALHASVTAPVGFTEAGVKLTDLFETLRGKDLTVVTAGSSSGQTIAGVMSTSTHGADFDRPPLPDYVRALALVSPAGERLWLEPKAQPLTRDDAAAHTLLPGARVVRDDRLFDAARVGVGAVGVVCALVIELRTTPLMSQKSTPLSWAAVRPMLVDGGTAFGPTPPGDAHPAAPGAKYTFLEVLLNPFRDAAGKRTARLVTRMEAPGTAPRWTRPRGSIFDSLVTLIVAANGNVSEYRAEIDDLLANGRRDSKGFHPAPDVFDYGPKRLERVWSYEAVLSTANDAHLGFLDALLSRWDGMAGQGKRVAGFLSVRFTRGTRTLLGMQQGPTGAAGRYCHVEFSPLQQPRGLPGWDPTRLAAEGERYVEAFLAEVIARQSSGVAALHWGQQAAHPTQMAPSAKRYDLLAWRAAWRELSGDAAFVSSNAWTVQAGLTPLSAPWKQVGSALPTDISRAPLDASGIAASAPVLLDGVLYAAEANGYVSSLVVDGSRPSARWTMARQSQERVQEDEAIRGAISVARNDDGRHEIFGRGTDGRIYHRWQKGNGWHDWTPLTGGPQLASDPAAARHVDRLVVAAVDAQGRVHTRRQSSLGWHGWSVFAALPGALRVVGRPALLRGHDGRVRMFVRDQTNKLWGAELDGAWNALGIEAAGDPAVALGFVGDVVVATPALNGGLRAAHVTSGWSVTPHATMARIPIRVRTSVAIARLTSEHVVAFTDRQGQVIHYRLRASGFRASSGPLPALAVSGPCLQPWPGDRVRVFTRVTHDVLQARDA